MSSTIARAPFSEPIASRVAGDCARSPCACRGVVPNFTPNASASVRDSGRSSAASCIALAAATPCEAETSILSLRCTRDAAVISSSVGFFGSCAMPFRWRISRRSCERSAPLAPCFPLSAAPASASIRARDFSPASFSSAIPAAFVPVSPYCCRSGASTGLCAIVSSTVGSSAKRVFSSCWVGFRPSAAAKLATLRVAFRSTVRPRIALACSIATWCSPGLAVFISSRSCPASSGVRYSLIASIRGFRKLRKPRSMNTLSVSRGLIPSWAASSRIAARCCACLSGVRSSRLIVPYRAKKSLPFSSWSRRTWFSASFVWSPKNSACRPSAAWARTSAFSARASARSASSVCSCCWRYCIALLLPGLPVLRRSAASESAKSIAATPLSVLGSPPATRAKKPGACSANPALALMDAPREVSRARSVCTVPAGATGSVAPAPLGIGSAAAFEGVSSGCSSHQDIRRRS